QVPDRRIVEVWDVQVRAPGSEQRQRQSGADRMRSRRHGQNPTLTVNQKVRLRGYWATSILRATGWIPKLLTSGSIPVQLLPVTTIRLRPLTLTRPSRAPVHATKLV